MAQVLRRRHHRRALDDTITHTLSTTLIGARRQGERILSGQRVDPEQVLADVKQAAAGA